MAERGKRRGVLAGVLGFLAVAGAGTGASALLPGASGADPQSPATTTTTTVAAVPAPEPAATTMTPSTVPAAPAAEPTTSTTATPQPSSTTTSTARPAPVAPAVTTVTTGTTVTTRTTPTVPAARPSAVTSFPSILVLAQAEVGGDQPRYTTEWGFSTGFWCAKFVSWLLAHAGIDVRDDGPADLKWKVQPVTDPKPGDLVFIDLAVEQGSHQTNHVAIVESVLPDGRVATIEGNGPDEDHVARSIRTPAEITGFGRAPAATLTAVVVPPPAPDCIWIEIGKPWMCE